jgi:hypothetical protein
MELNSSTSKSPEKSKESFVKNSPSSEKLCSQQIQRLIENYSEPEKAREFLVHASIIDKDGNLMPPYQPDPQDELDKWRSEGRGALFF